MPVKLILIVTVLPRTSGTMPPIWSKAAASFSRSNCGSKDSQR